MALYYQRLRPGDIGEIFAPWIHSRVPSPYRQPYGVAANKLVPPPDLYRIPSYDRLLDLWREAHESEEALEGMSALLMQEAPIEYFLRESGFVAPVNGIRSTYGMLGPTEPFYGLPPNVPDGVPVIDGTFTTFNGETVVVHQGASDLNDRLETELKDLVQATTLFLDSEDPSVTSDLAISVYALPLVAAHDALLHVMSLRPDDFWQPFMSMFERWPTEELRRKLLKSKDLWPYVYILLDATQPIPEATMLAEVLNKLSDGSNLAEKLATIYAARGERLATFLAEGDRNNTDVNLGRRLVRLREAILLLMEGSATPNLLLSSLHDPSSSLARSFLAQWTPGHGKAEYFRYLDNPAVRKNMARRLDGSGRGHEIAIALLRAMRSDVILAFSKMRTTYVDSLGFYIADTIGVDRSFSRKLVEVYEEYQPYRVFVERWAVARLYYRLRDHQAEEHHSTAATVIASSAIFRPAGIEVLGGDPIHLSTQLVIDFHVPEDLSALHRGQFSPYVFTTPPGREMHADLFVKHMFEPQVMGMVRELRRVVNQFGPEVDGQWVRLSMRATANLALLPSYVSATLAKLLLERVPNIQRVGQNAQGQELFAFRARHVQDLSWFSGDPDMDWIVKATDPADDDDTYWVADNPNDGTVVLDTTMDLDDPAPVVVSPKPNLQFTNKAIAKRVRSSLRRRQYFPNAGIEEVEFVDDVQEDRDETEDLFGAPYYDETSLREHLARVMRQPRTGKRIRPAFDPRRGIFTILGTRSVSEMKKEIKKRKMLRAEDERLRQQQDIESVLPPSNLRFSQRVEAVDLAPFAVVSPAREQETNWDSFDFDLYDRVETPPSPSMDEPSSSSADTSRGSRSSLESYETLDDFDDDVPAASTPVMVRIGPQRVETPPRISTPPPSLSTILDDIMTETSVPDMESDLDLVPEPGPELVPSPGPELVPSPEFDAIMQELFVDDPIGPAPVNVPMNEDVLPPISFGDPSNEFLDSMSPQPRKPNNNSGPGTPDIVRMTVQESPDLFTWKGMQEGQGNKSPDLFTLMGVQEGQGVKNPIDPLTAFMMH